jgi:hypothetical protein
MIKETLPESILKRQFGLDNPEFQEEEEAKVAPLLDKRHLHLLNRKERQLWKKWLSKGETKLINLTLPVEAFGPEDTIIKGENGQPPTVKGLLLRSLRAPLQTDQQQSFKEKNERYLIIKRLQAVDEIELTAAEVKLLKERVGRIFLDPEIVGKLGEVLVEPAA